MPATIEIEGVRFTSPDRVVFPEQGITKRELAEYYRAVAPWILPMLRDRPLTLLRCPRGQEKECFVQRRAGEGIPDAVRRVDIPDEDEDDGTATHLSVDSLAGLLGLVQIGVLELHTWGSRRDRLDRPDRMVVDLDPDPSVPFAAVADAAFVIRERLTDAGLRAFVMTTGGKGLHVVAPLRRSVDWDTVKGTARALAEGLEAAAPERFVSRAAKSERTGRIYVDYLRNGWGATSIAAYSTRARAGAPVATPISWEELEGGISPGDFTVATVPARLQTLAADPWADYRASAVALSRAVRDRLGG
jgi:bifunctional non-homologous end joining protein LigD